MQIRPMVPADLPCCADILCSVYNNDLWQCRWEKPTATEYLSDFFGMAKFVGFAAEEDGCLIGALFAHEKVWWNNSEIFIEEMFVRPDHQGKDVGSALLKAAEGHALEKGLAGLTLSTNRYAPAPHFYRKNGFEDCSHVLFMARELRS